MATIGNRGKYAEGRVKLYLKSLESSNTTHHRYPDARSGSFVATPCDFMVLRSGKLALVEVKEVDHDFRLPHKNVSPDQVARMRNWKAAGAAAFLLIYSSTLKLWRCIDVDFFVSRTGGSWDLREFPATQEKLLFPSVFNEN